MFIRILKGALLRRGSRHLFTAVAITPGTTVATSTLSAMSDVSDKVNQELKSYGANIVVCPRGAAILNDLYGAESPEQAHLREDELSNIRTIFWAYSILDFASLLPVEVTDLTGTQLTLTDTWFAHHLDLAAGESLGTGLNKLRGWWTIEGEWATDAEPTGVMLGTDYAARNSLRPGDTLTLSRGGSGVELRVKGVCESGDEANSSIYVPLETAQTLLGQSGVVGSIEVSASITSDNDLTRKTTKNPQSLSVSERETWYCTAYVSSTAYQIEKVMTDSVTRPVWQVAESEGTILVKTQLLMVLVTILSLTASALAIANLITANIMERLAEIGLMKAVGAKNRSIIALFLTEITIAGLLGGGLGYAARLGLAQITGRMVFASPIALTPVALALVILLVLPVALGVSIPAIRYLLRLNAAEVLHGKWT